ncbi:hypothetical protein HYH03_000626 [Edaphochlamys debaryana]|uniref:DUF1365-domain-containing protein n=1 Tax=Edaphochlamys debaryana TaxID=47281 RepID=A0A836C7D5_9CHLO|nr:hypothetical protein HYH03_000626 [Edaphochlamys debaryana]|eukprot:KAG2502138.1 hypothetical protein HYH03_000626 [Edaphochlamys debaryana]
MDWVLVAQAFALLGCIAWHSFFALLSLPSALLHVLGILKSSEEDKSCTFYEGKVLHIRRAPAHNEFRYAVRMAVLDLEAPPSWFKAQAADHMTADEARKFAGTTGPVKLLTDPMTAGYVQNPISIYYCYGGGGGSEAGAAAKQGQGKQAAPRLERCIAEVTNTPWGERVSFVFNPAGEAVGKALHVSPFMDMQNTWHLEAPEPTDRLRLVVKASHPQYGDYFYADLVGRTAPRPHAPSERAGLRELLSFGFMPHRVALLIYWQALVLIWKGVPLHMPPAKEYQARIVAEQGGQAADGGKQEQRAKQGVAANGSPATTGHHATANGAAHPGPGVGLCPLARVGAAAHAHPRNGVDGKHFLWREAAGWPWR